MPGGDSADDLLRWIQEATAPVTGRAYFRSLTQRLAQSLGVRAALITECLDESGRWVRTLAYWADNDFAEDIAFDVRGTPCEDILHGGAFFFLPSGLEEYYPGWAAEEGGLRSGVGISVNAPDDGRLIGHIAVFHDQELHDHRIVESIFRIIAARAGAELQRLQTESALRRSEARAQDHLRELAHLSRVASMGEMASALTHELRQPLTAIHTYCKAAGRLLESDDPDLSRARETLQRASQRAEQAAELITHLRNYVQPLSERYRSEDPRQLLQDTCRLLRPECDSRGVALTLDVPDTLPAVEMDRVQIQQVIVNLAYNGLQAIETVSGTRDGSLRIEASAPEGERLAVSIIDNGDGIPEEIAERIFEPFVTGRNQGMGIGLSLCQSIIHYHGGELGFTTDSHGTRFSFTLPAADGFLAASV